MFIIAYKVFGRDIIQFVIGLLFIMIVLIVSFFFYRNNCDRVVLISRKWHSEGRGWEKQYETISGDDDYKTAAVILFCVGIVVGIGIIFL